MRFKGWNIVLYQGVKNSDLIVTHLWLRLYPGWQETVEEYIQKNWALGKANLSVSVLIYAFVLHPGAQHKIYKVFCSRMYQLWFKIFNCGPITYCVIQDVAVDYET